MSTPAWGAWLASQWGPSYEGPDSSWLGASASNVVGGQNPPYTLQDFFAQYPKFGGPPITPAPTTTTVQGSPTLTVTSSTGMAAGNPIAGAGIPDGALIQSVTDGTHIVLSANATASASGVTLTVWNALPIPFLVISLYIAAASACLVQARWIELWPLAMALYVAHFLTLYARSDGNPNSTIGQIAAQGLSLGVQTSKAAGDVSVSYQPVTGLEDWGAWALTLYGEQLAQFAKAIGSGGALAW